MIDRTRFRLQDIVDAIDQITGLLKNKSLNDVTNDRILRAAFERFLEILSKASRSIPEDMKASTPQIPWSRVGNIGNHLRHAYHRVDAEILWSIYANGELANLKGVVIRFLQATL